jgi:hypothetical protein
MRLSLRQFMAKPMRRPYSMGMGVVCTSPGSGGVFKG